MGARLTVAEALPDNIDVSADKQANFGLTRGTYSIFNKFSMFRYHKYGPNFTDYRGEYHFDVQPNNGDPAPSTQEQANRLNTLIGGNTLSSLGNNGQFNGGSDQQNSNAGQIVAATGYLPTNISVARPIEVEDKAVMQNPTARTIIDWAKNPNNVFGPTPYTWTDFIYAKWNGKIPNNRMITLRRYPFPVRDNLKNVSQETLIPVTQAITWFGEKANNKLKEIIPGMGWSLPWKMLDAQDGVGMNVQGNNLTIDDLLGALEQTPLVGGGVTKIKTLLKGLLGAAAGQRGDTKIIDDLSGRTAQYQEFLKNQLYSSSGPYWNQVIGGVNYITQTMIRDRMGVNTDWQKPIKLNFTYALRSFNGIKPKIAMLDLISNFLNLTYMNAEFKGNFTRFFRNASGLTSNTTIDDAIGKSLQENDALGGLALAAASVAYDALSTAATLSDIKLSGVVSNFGSFKQYFEQGKIDAGTAIGTSKDGKTLKIGDVINGAMLATSWRSLAKAPVVMRSTLSGEPVGEWHLTVGNPIEPIATIGNLICTGCQMEFGDELGPDDFPMEVTFTVTLQMGRPRDKFDIESMFNLGNGFLSENPIVPPDSANNTFGNGAGGPDDNTLVRNASVNSTGLAQKIQTAKLNQSQERSITTTRTRLKSAYGSVYADSAILPLYFMDNTQLKALNTDGQKTVK